MEKTGTLADLIDCSDALPFYLAFDPDDDSVDIKDIYEGREGTALVDEFFKLREKKDSFYDDDSGSLGEFDDYADYSDNERLKFLQKLRKSVDTSQHTVNTVRESVDAKYEGMYKLVYSITSGNSDVRHAFIYGDPGIGKSYSINKAAAEGVKDNSHHPELLTFSGSAATSLSGLIGFFFTHRANKVIILDDCDGFITSPSMDIQNFLKALLDPDGHAVSSSLTMLNQANIDLKKAAILQRDMEKKAAVKVDTSKVNEGMASVTVNGKRIDFNVTPEEGRFLESMFPLGTSDRAKALYEDKLYKSDRRYDKFGHLITYREGDYYGPMISDDPFEDDFEEEDKKDDPYERTIKRTSKKDLKKDDIDIELVPPTWYFDSSLIFISNLNEDQINDAVKSRCTTYRLHLANTDEFLCRAKEILPNLHTENKLKTYDPVVENWCKKEAFALFCAGIDDNKNTNGLVDIKVNAPLEFRMLIAMSDALMRDYLFWRKENDIPSSDQTNPENFQKWEDERAAKFMRNDLRRIVGDTPNR